MKIRSSVIRPTSPAKADFVLSSLIGASADSPPDKIVFSNWYLLFAMNHRKLLSITFVTIAICICIIGVLHICAGVNSDLPFDPTTWKRTEETSVRMRMVHDLLNNHKLIGMQRKDLVQLLGNPRMDVQGTLFPEYDCLYLLGTQKSLLDEDGVWLCVKFRDNRVSEVRIGRD